MNDNNNYIENERFPSFFSVRKLLDYWDLDERGLTAPIIFNCP